MTLILGVVGGFIVLMAFLAFWPIIATAGFGLVCFLIAIGPEVGNGGRALALLGVFGAIWLCRKFAAYP